MTVDLGFGVPSWTLPVERLVASTTRPGAVPRRLREPVQPRTCCETSPTGARGIVTGWYGRFHPGWYCVVVVATRWPPDAAVAGRDFHHVPPVDAEFGEPGTGGLRWVRGRRARAPVAAITALSCKLAGRRSTTLCQLGFDGAHMSSMGTCTDRQDLRGRPLVVDGAARTASLVEHVVVDAAAPPTTVPPLDAQGLLH